MESSIIVRAGFTAEKLESEYESDVAERLEKKLEKYFSGKKVSFAEFKVMYPTKFSERVLEEVRRIGYGEVRTYLEVAKKLGTSPRAVGVALKINRVPVVVPCHRVVAKNSLGGYSYGVDVKKKLLELEGVECVSLRGSGSL